MEALVDSINAIKEYFVERVTRQVVKQVLFNSSEYKSNECPLLVIGSII